MCSVANIHSSLYRQSYVVKFLGAAPDPEFSAETFDLVRKRCQHHFLSFDSSNELAAIATMVATKIRLSRSVLIARWQIQKSNAPVARRYSVS